MNDWITDKKPPQQELVIVSIKDDTSDKPYYYTACGWYFNGIWVVDNDVCMMVNAWMPLPKPFIQIM